MKAIFLDRDGVINKEKDYLYKIEDFEFINGCFETLEYLQDRDFLLFIITNQSGIGRGYYKEKDFLELTDWMISEFLKKGINISQVEYCKHGPNENCKCRKPKTGMIDNILKNFKIDLGNSWLIGDKNSDIICARNSGIKNTIQVKSGHSFDETKSEADYICYSIKEVVNIIK